MQTCTKNLFIGLSILLLSCAANQKAEMKRETRTVTGYSKNKLEVLDWGGEGQTILFLAGLGNTAHVFNDFAPRFTDKFHVLALTRRGFGKSEPSGGYDLTALTGDILSVLDSLHIQKVILAGHSIAGEEITKFAALHPEKVDKIIYIDAAYDRMGMDTLLMDPPQTPLPKKEDSASLESLQKYYASIMGVSVPSEEIRETSIFSKEGRYIKDVTADSIFGALIAGTIHPEYNKVKCPALAIYAVFTKANEVLPFYARLDSMNAKKADKLFKGFANAGKQEQKRFKNEVKNGTIREITGGNHYLFISNPDDVEKIMRDFLK